MRQFRLDRRASGVLLHVTSLPGPYGCGDIGSAARSFLRFLRASRQRWWQMLPVGPVGPHGVPYSSDSAFAGAELLIDLVQLRDDGLLNAEDLRISPELHEGEADYAAAKAFRSRCLSKAFDAFRERGGRDRRTFARFCHDQAAWLDDFSLYCALKDVNGGAPWHEWDDSLRLRRPAALEHVRKELRERIDYVRFTQYIFERQWRRLRNEAHRRGIGLIGDMPFFVSYDSADVWAHQHLFRLDANGAPEVVSGVPPDYFSATGQRWGHPHYAWNHHERDGYRWWVERIRRQSALFDAVRIDHFIALVRHWEIPADSETAEHGRWTAGPGAALLHRAFDALGDVRFIAEDLGSTSSAVGDLRRRFGIPGMRVLQFGFSGDDDEHQPHRYERRCVVYPGTHDNNTAQGWWREKLDQASAAEHPEETELARARLYLGTEREAASRDMVRAAMTSVADLAIIPAQDLLGLGDQARMNHPGGSERNWRWRLLPDQLSHDVADWLRRLTSLSGRA